jgi:hypothetical protein
MQEILIDGGQFVFQNFVQEIDGDGIAGDGGVRLGAGRYSAATARA